MSDSKYCGNCGAENDKDSKYCGSCGKDLDNINTSKKSAKSKPKRLSKFRTKKNYGILAIVILAAVAFSYFLLPGLIFGNHYDDGFVSFNYPNNLNVDPGQNDLLTGDYGEVIAQVTNGVDVDNGGYSVTVYMSPVSLDANNVLQNALSGFTTSNGSAPKQTANNGFTLYDLGSETTNLNYLNNTAAATVLVKKGDPFFFIIYLTNSEPNGSQNYTDANNAYKQIVKTFKLD
jgi:hypothetical protein